MSIPQVTTSFSSVPSITADLVQRYSNVMNDLLASYFPLLNTAPDALYIMMATMELESGYRIYHNRNTTPNHVSIGVSSGIGRSFWNDPVVVPVRNNGDPTSLVNVSEGLSAKALMATMGMYQVRNCRESNNLLSGGNYRGLAESNGLMVNAGNSISAIFTNDDDGARKSMILGCIVMENKYKARLARNSEEVAIQLAVGDYLGKAGAKDILGTTPETRITNIFDGTNNIGNTLIAAQLLQHTANKVYTNPPRKSAGGAETKKTVSATTDNVRINTNGCNRA